jgi:hypothetical protein
MLTAVRFLHSHPELTGKLSENIRALIDTESGNLGICDIIENLLRKTERAMVPEFYYIDGFRVGETEFRVDRHSVRLLTKKGEIVLTSIKLKLVVSKLNIASVPVKM